LEGHFSVAAVCAQAALTPANNNGAAQAARQKNLRWKEVMDVSLFFHRKYFVPDWTRQMTGLRS